MEPKERITINTIKYPELSDDELKSAIEKVFCDPDDFYELLHPSVKRLVAKGAVKALEEKAYNVGGYEIRFKPLDTDK